MPDRDARNQLAELVRHLLAGTMTTYRFVVAASTIAGKSVDPAVHAVYEAAGSLYADLFWSRRLRGRYRVPREVRRRMAVAIMFLYSETEYQWPAPMHLPGGCRDCLLAYACGFCLMAGLTVLFFYPIISIVCFGAAIWAYRFSQGLVAKLYRQWKRAQMQIGDYDVWPFLRRVDVDEAKKHPRLLTGGANG